MSLSTNVSDLATRVATEIKAVRTLVNGNAGDLSALTTANKTNLVAALNELQTEVNAAVSGGGASINDTTTTTAATWSSTKIDSSISAAIAALVNGAPAALDTLNELATELAENDGAIAAINTALGNRVRVDAAQAFDDTQKAQARTNIGAGTSSLVIGTTGGTAADAGVLATSLSGKSDTGHTHAGADVAAATETLRGTVELATTAEALAGTDTTRAVTAAGVKTVADTKASSTHSHAGSDVAIATDTTRGTVEFATTVETTTGTSTVLAVTPAGVKAVGDTKAPLTHSHTGTEVEAASETGRGTIELATVTETTTGTDAVRAVTPATLKAVADTKANSADVGSTSTNFVTIFEAGLV